MNVKYQQAKKDGICTRCYIAPAAEGRTKCLNCLDYEAVAQMVYVGKMTPEQKAEFKRRVNLNAKKRRAQRVKNRICTRCGKTPADDGYKTCRKCREKITKEQRRKRLYG